MAGSSACSCSETVFEGDSDSGTESDMDLASADDSIELLSDEALCLESSLESNSDKISSASLGCCESLNF